MRDDSHDPVKPRPPQPTEPPNIWEACRKRFGECPPVMAIGSHYTKEGIGALMEAALKSGRRLTPHRLWKHYGTPPPPRDAEW